MSDTARNEETNQIDRNRNGANGRTAPKPPTAGLRPRAARRQRNAAKSVRGLPDISIIRDLATIYLKEQRRHWPKFVQLGFLPDPAQAEAVTAMAETFCDRHTSGALPDVDPALLKQGPKLAASYSRYSCDNSSPSSVADQVVNELRKAKEEGRFIPWEYCLADYAVSGLDRDRTDYSSAKNALADQNRRVDTLYIDDFTRASRDDLEWWRLAGHVRRHRKRLIGASDGFDLTGDAGDIQVSVFALLSKLFIKSLREKVGRGMRGAARRGTSTGKPALGYTLAPMLDEEGELEGAEGWAVMTLAIDPETRKYIEMAFQLYGVEKGWSYGRIAKHFNALKVDGSDPNRKFEGKRVRNRRMPLRKHKYVDEFLKVCREIEDIEGPGIEDQVLTGVTAQLYRELMGFKTELVGYLTEMTPKQRPKG